MYFIEQMLCAEGDSLFGSPLYMPYGWCRDTAKTMAAQKTLPSLKIYGCAAVILALDIAVYSVYSIGECRVSYAGVKLF